MTQVSIHLHLVTTSVISTDSSVVFLPWTIIQFNESYSVLDFFLIAVKPRLDNDDCTLQSARVGQEMHSLVHVDTNLPLIAIVPSHGKYLQFKVNVPSIHTTEDVTIQEDLSFISPILEKNRKDALYNRIVHFFNGSSVGLLQEEIHLGKKLVASLRDLFWYLDGHYHIFERINKPISTSFNCFIGYNVPELSKHRKRMTRNLSSDQLRKFATDLSAMLLESYWERNCWRDIKQQFSDLVESLASYSDYLVDKNKKIKANHRSPTPVRDLPENMSLKFLEPTEEVPTPLQPIDELLESLTIYKYLSITHLLPLDSLRKHRLLNLLISSGLSSPSMLCIYNPGGGIRNLQFLWRLPQESDDPNVYFEHSQPVVEKIKAELPVFHSRAMRTAMYEKFGRISPNVKPSVLRYFYKELTGELLIF